MVKIDDSICLKIKNFSKDLDNIFKVNNIYVYGSYSKGTQNEWSDIDLAVVIDEPEPDSFKIFSIAKNYDIRFDALGFSKEDFDNSYLPIIPEIKDTGIKII